MVTETQLENGYAAQIDGWFERHAQTGMLSMADGVECAFAIVLAQTATPDSASCAALTKRQTLVISSGRVESYVKYKEVIFDLHHAGFDIFIMDHRGQGLSQRSSPNPMHGYINDFQQYVDDLLCFVDEVVYQYCAQPLLLCHSMGSTIGALAILQRPQQFAKVVFSAPMFGLRVPLPIWLAHIVMKLGLLTSQLVGRPMYFIGQGDYAPVAFSQNRLMQSSLRYARFRESQQQYPETQLGGVTYQWVAAANIALARLHAQADQLTLPVLCLSAQDDVVVDNQLQQTLVKQMPNARWQDVPESRHEILFEKDAIRNPALTTIVRFLQDK
ncbi:MAG: alpha/beta fold hydrolase [Glaciecola sp.]|jgi:lysophospholipase|nr:alpha/beta fold hydrolase [Glaciecola sp.]MDG1469484.1 alpha/beta fold hydrolase [Glaciecola sp.]MDG1922345.1 alpha/beta fold hydrolase [Glaciecola sp.]